MLFVSMCLDECGQIDAIGGFSFNTDYTVNRVRQHPEAYFVSVYDAQRGDVVLENAATKVLLDEANVVRSATIPVEDDDVATLSVIDRYEVRLGVLWFAVGWEWCLASPALSQYRLCDSPCLHWRWRCHYSRRLREHHCAPVRCPS